MTFREKLRDREIPKEKNETKSINKKEKKEMENMTASDVKIIIEDTIYTPINVEITTFPTGERAEIVLEVPFWAGKYCRFTTPMEIENVIFNGPATIILWTDGTKTVVKCDGEQFDPEKGIAMAIAKKAMGNTREYFLPIKRWTGKYYKQQKKAAKINKTKTCKKPETMQIDIPTITSMITEEPTDE